MSSEDVICHTYTGGKTLMYLPPSFSEDRLEVLHALIKARSLGTLITAGEGGLLANLIPFVLNDNGPYGTLQCHLAKANGQLRALKASSEILVLFQGPDTYMTPNWYATKAISGEVVPTWNYVMVQARGVPRVIDDPVWLRAQIDQLTQSREGTRPSPWTVADAPESYIASQIKGIVGVEIPITKLEGKWKVSQNRTEADRESIAENLRLEGNEIMAKLVERYGVKKSD